MLLSLERVSKRFAGSPGREAQALKDVTLQLERGQMLGIYGPTGAGKSTLLRIAAGLIAPDSGDVLYDGQALHELSTREHRRLRRREISCLWSGQGCQEHLSAIVTEPRLLLADGPASSLSLIEQEMVMGLLGALAREASAGVLVADSEAAALALYGPSGSGKSTLLLLAAGLLRADRGSVRFDGRELASMSRGQALAYRREQLGFVFQGFNLAAGLSAEENAAIPLLMRGVEHREARRRARVALEDVGLAHRLAHTPERLSGGEQQRVAIARALVGEPRLVLADEPTGNLDSETGVAVLGLLGGLARGRRAAVLLVTHDERAAGFAERTLAIRDGRLSEGEDASADQSDAANKNQNQSETQSQIESSGARS